MKIYEGIESFDKLLYAVVTPGTFDGVHKGHRTILNRVSELAKKNGGESVVLTFHPHPRIVLQGEDTNLRLLTTLEEKAELLRKAGIDHFIIHPFTVDFSRTSVVYYVRDMLVGKIGMKHMVIGYDHHFGRNRAGNLENLLELAPLYEFEIEEIPAKEIDAVSVSSTKIRKALVNGDVDLAAEYLGYEYSLTGTVQKGQQIGRRMGFPTANIQVDNALKMIPGEGVYAVRVTVDSRQHHGMLNIGKRPTVDEQSADRSIEVHLLDFDGKLYGKRLTLSFVSRLRNEMRFSDLDGLKNQLIKDRESVRSLFKELTG